jgi:hypothetical protein
VNGIPKIFAVAVFATNDLSPAEATSADIGSETSYLTNAGESSHILSRKLMISS